MEECWGGRELCTLGNIQYYTVAMWQELFGELQCRKMGCKIGFVQLAAKPVAFWD